VVKQKHMQIYKHTHIHAGMNLRLSNFEAQGQKPSHSLLHRHSISCQVWSVNDRLHLACFQYRLHLV